MEAHAHHTHLHSSSHSELPTHKHHGLSGEESVGGDGTWREEERVVANGEMRSDENIGGMNGGTRRAVRANGAASAIMFTARTKQQIQTAKDNTVSAGLALPPLVVLSTQSNASI